MIARAVRGGTTAGHWHTDSERFTPLPADDAAAIPCPECWAGISHTGPGWRWHQQHTATDRRTNP